MVRTVLMAPMTKQHQIERIIGATQALGHDVTAL